VRSDARRPPQTINTRCSPPIWAIVVGIAYSAIIDAPLPLFIDTALEQMGATVTPVACIAIGAFAFDRRPTSVVGAIPRHLWQLRVVAYTAAKLFLLPAICLALFSSPAFAFSFAERQMGVIISVMPLAVSAFVFSSKFDADSRVMAAAIVLTTALTLPALLIWIPVI
jgi:predicted permease